MEKLAQDVMPAKYGPEFLAGLMATPELARNVAIVGHLGHGKTTVGAATSFLFFVFFLVPVLC